DPYELFRRHDLQMSGQLSRPFLDGRLLLTGGLNYDAYLVVDNDPRASASFGSVEGRISIQKDFISNLSDSLKSGIGAMVDADMEAVSARLQALQTQQQLAVQSLSIANQAPQTILSLFR
ncbi:MAG: flagellin, partial [Pseudomonadota bacterium]